MRALERLKEPALLEEKGPQWLKAFLQSGKSRPSSNQYNHPRVQEALRAMSHGKCFFCERPVTPGNDETVEHFVGVAEEPNRTFEWTNLHLCCRSCQATVAVVEQELDPTVDDPTQHLRFDEEVAKPLSVRGGASIARRKLNDTEHQLLRLKSMREFRRVVLEAAVTQPLTASDRQMLRRKAEPTQPYSAMFRCVLDDAGI